MNTNEITTQDFCDTFVIKEKCRGVLAKFIAAGHLPVGVIKDDPRVIQIVKWCQEWVKQKKGEGSDS